MNLVVPEITAVSNPKRKLPSAETIVANRRFLFIMTTILEVRRCDYSEMQKDFERSEVPAKMQYSCHHTLRP